MRETKTASIVFSVVFGVGLSLLPRPGQAQGIFHIGSLNTAEQFVNAFEGFKTRMAELGYQEGRNVRYEFYNSKGNTELLKTFAQKLVQDKADLIVTSSTSATVAAAKATEGTKIPVLFLSAGNPQKLVQSFASSGSNLAGISSASLEVTGKRFELLRELAPWVKRIAVPADRQGINYRDILIEVREAAARLGFTLWEVEVANRDEILKVAPTITRNKVDAVFTPADSLVTSVIEVIVKQANKEKLPLITSLVVNVERGCLATYAADYFSLGKQGAALADKILKGIKPKDLPIELPYKLNLVLNLKTAREIGLKIPRDILLRADQVFE